MEKYIEEVVNEDRLVREKVEEAKRQLLEITNLVSSKSSEIYEQYMEEEKLQMETLRKKVEEEIRLVEEQCQKEKEEGLALLKNQYESNKDHWVDQIVKNCLS